METLSPPVSPKVVARILMIQKPRARAGTLLRASLLVIGGSFIRQTFRQIASAELERGRVLSIAGFDLATTHENSSTFLINAHKSQRPSFIEIAGNLRKPGAVDCAVAD